MFGNEEVRLTRDVEANHVPSGDKLTLKKGDLVQITQALGGSYTVLIQGNMAQIDSSNADALGKKKEKSSDDVLREEQPFNEQLVWDQLKTCYDPEIPVNIVDLGLIYDCRVWELENEAHRVNIKMTLTAPGCGMGPVIADDVKRKVEAIPSVEVADVELVWEPQWNMDMVSESAKLQMGIL
ncbi:MAG TPA: putative Fe-S cluster assembly protein SufT [Candidatus Marinimicrobia bacterium]|jgi:probable FeS assembly SUF system protein SufT|nr:putative Fe-S cluster assembly protein SufT [Candidatus Neomarinimicrobiota bacterium]|tara:strand:- start:2961 stop:3506 length:546 start_codon:yes stop_codon:yes gene_type:complete